MARPPTIHLLFILHVIGVTLSLKEAVKEASPMHGGLSAEDYASLASHKADLTSGHYKQNVGGSHSDSDYSHHGHGCQHYASYRYNDGSFTASTGRRVHYSCSSHCNCMNGVIRCEKEKCSYKYYSPYFYSSGVSHSGFYTSQHHNPFSNPFFNDAGYGSGFGSYRSPYHHGGSNLGGSGFARPYGGSNYGRSYGTGYSYGNSYSYGNHNRPSYGGGGSRTNNRWSYSTGGGYGGGHGGHAGGHQGGHGGHQGGHGGSYDPHSYHSHDSYSRPYDNGRGVAHGNSDEYGYEHRQTYNHNSGGPHSPNFERNQGNSYNTEQGKSYQSSYRHSTHSK